MEPIKSLAYVIKLRTSLKSEAYELVQVVRIFTFEPTTGQFDDLLYIF